MSGGDTGHCGECGRSFRYDLIHNGFNDSAYAYCDRCGKTSILSGWHEGVPEGAGLKLHQVIGQGVERFLCLCECGGSFRRGAAPRCPHCRAELSAAGATEFLEKNAPGTKQGWRWQQSWEGLYCIIIEGRSISDNWKES